MSLIREAVGVVDDVVTMVKSPACHLVPPHNGSLTLPDSVVAADVGDAVDDDVTRVVEENQDTGVSLMVSLNTRMQFDPHLSGLNQY